MRYLVTGPGLRFRGADGHMIQVDSGDWVQFEAGDKVSVPFLLAVGAIEPIGQSGVVTSPTLIQVGEPGPEILLHQEQETSWQ